MVMNILVPFFGVFTVVLLIFFITVFVFGNNTLYCKIFERKTVNLYNKILRLPNDEFTLDYESFQLIGYYQFNIKSYPDWHVWFDRNKQFAAVSDKETHECILGDFYEKGSHQLYQKMCMLLPDMMNGFRNKYKHVFMFIEDCDKDLKYKLELINKNNLVSNK